MRKFLKSTIALICGVVVSLSAAACGDDNGGGRGPEVENIDKQKTQIYVLNYNGGIGDQWLRDLKKRFESEYANYEGDDGKVGVQVYIDNTKTNCTGDVSEALKTSRDHVWFTEVIPYYTVLKSNGFYDITPAMKGSLSAFGEEGSIEDKLTEQQKDYLKVDGKYYGLPSYSTYPVIVYDQDIFRDYKLYFAYDEENSDDGFIPAKSARKSVGADGIEGTDDDGLPITFDDFEKLCDRMVKQSVTPFTWTGLYREYYQFLVAAMRVCYDGYDTEYLRYTFDGEAQGLVDVASDGTITAYNGTGTATINKDNAYLLNKTEGTYRSIDFFSKIIKNKWYTFQSEKSHIDAQADFIMGNLEGNPIAMLIEGTWWENEAEEGFKLSVARGGEEYSRHNRHFGVMHLPSQYEDGKQTTIDMNYSLTFANAYVMNNSSEKVKNLVMEFLKFAHTNESLRAFTRTVGVYKGFNYSLTDSDKEQLSPFCKQVVSMRESADVVYPYSSKQVYKDNEGLMKPHETSLWFNTEVNEVLYPSPLDAFYTASNKLNSIEYFNGLQTYWKNRWSRALN